MAEITVQESAIPLERDGDAQAFWELLIGFTTPKSGGDVKEQEVDLEDLVEEAIESRRQVTMEVIERAVNNWVGRTFEDVQEVVYVNVEERRQIRKTGHAESPSAEE